MLSFIVKSICARLGVETPGPFERCGRPPGNFKDFFIFDVPARAEQPGQLSSLIEWQGLLRCDVWRVPDLGCEWKSCSCSMLFYVVLCCFVVMGTMKCSSGHLHQLCRQWFGVWPSSSSLFWYLAVGNHWFVLNSVIQRYPEKLKQKMLHQNSWPQMSWVQTNACCNLNPGLFDLPEDAEAHSISEIASDIHMEKKAKEVALSQDPWGPCCLHIFIWCKFQKI